MCSSDLAGGVGTVAMRGLMNLYSLLLELDQTESGMSSESLIDLIQNSDQRPSFWGHPYTCDGNQIPGLPALCAPQQKLFYVIDGELAPAHDGWIDTPALFAEIG